MALRPIPKDKKIILPFEAEFVKDFDEQERKFVVKTYMVLLDDEINEENYDDHFFSIGRDVFGRGTDADKARKIYSSIYEDINDNYSEGPEFETWLEGRIRRLIRVCRLGDVAPYREALDQIAQREASRRGDAGNTMEAQPVEDSPTGSMPETKQIPRVVRKVSRPKNSSQSQAVVSPTEEQVPKEKTAVAQSSDNDDDGKKPLQRAMGQPAAFPVEALGDLAEVCLELKELVYAPLAICGQARLAAVVLAVQALANVVIDVRVRPISMFFLTVGMTGERKTAVDDLVLKPFREYEWQLRDAYDQAMMQYQIDLEEYEHRKKQARKIADPDARAEAIGSAPIAPSGPVIITDDPTIEGLGKSLHSGQPSMGIYSDEGGKLFGGYGMSSEHLIKTIAGLSKLWDGTPFNTVRAANGFQAISGKRVSFHVMVQPEIAAKVIGNRIMQGQGFLSRVLPSWPDSTIGQRFYQKGSEHSQEVVREYQCRITTILKAPKPIREGTVNELEPRELPLSDDALECYIRFHDEIESELRPSGKYSSIRGFASKGAEHACRIAGALTLYEDISAKIIPMAKMEQGVELGRYYLKEALRVIGAGAVNPDLELAEELLAWLQKRGQQHSLVEVYQKGPMRIRDAETARRIVALLVEHGWVRKVPHDVRIKGRRRREVYELT
ncbi:MAG: YfjI family protein [Desulfuromonadales bacterium]